MSRRSHTMTRVRCVPSGRMGLFTDDRVLWQTSTRRFGRLDASLTAHARTRNLYVKRHLRHIQFAHERHMRVLWTLGDTAAFDIAYRRGVQTLCVIAGLHLAIQRRARRGNL